ncbi:MAG: DNA internalization-related competence protein ComEC/Rec2 [Acidobacteriota bacterium]
MAMLACAMAFGRRRPTVGLLLAAFVAIVAARSAQWRDAALAPPVAVWFAEAKQDDAVMAEGWLVGDAEPSVDETMRARVALEALEVRGQRIETSGIVQWYVGGRSAPAAPEWTNGRHVRAPVVWRWPRVTHNPGSPNRQWQALLRGYVLAGSVKSAALVSVDRASWWQEWPADARRRVRTVLTDTVARRDPVAAAIAIAILIGDRSRLDPDVIASLRDAGTYHVVAISGGNVALVIAALTLGLRGAVRSFRWGAALAIPGVLAYAAVVGGDPSVDRAIAAAVVYLAAELTGLLIEPLDVLAVVIGGLVLYDPVVAVTPAAWLSFGATTGIVLGAERVVRVAAALRQAPVSLWNKVRRWGLGIVAATVAAELALVPVSTAVFSRVSVAGLVLNLVAIPAMAVVELAGLALVFLDGVPVVGTLAVWAVVGGVRALLGSARVVPLLPWLTWRAPPSSAVWLIVFYGGAVAALSLQGRWRRWPVAAAAGALVVIVTAPGVWLARPPRGWLRLTVIDVGQGDALLVQFASGRSLLVDGGPSSEAFDSGERVVTPTLWALGVRRLDWLAFTHADLDHIGGTMAVADTFGPREVWEGVPVPRDERRARLRTAALERGQIWRQLRAGDIFDVGDVSVEVMSPPVPDWERQRVRNDDSLVLRIRDGDVELLLTGDIGQAVEAALPVNKGLEPALRILKVAHHGSRSSSSDDFVKRYAPDLALISVGRNNTFGHPSPEVVRRFRDVGAAIARTDEEGAISVETDGREIRVKTWSGRTLTMRKGSPAV